jgi:hypothetical protein
MTKGENMQQKLRELARLQPPGSRFFKSHFSRDAITPEVKEPVRKSLLDSNRKVDKT